MMTPRALAAGSVGIGILVFGLKFWAWKLTGSVALYSDAIESIVNVVAALAALYAVHLASQPADERHPYGHHKAEYMAAVLEGSLILAAAVSIFMAAWSAWRQPTIIETRWTGIAINVVAGLINAAWCMLLLREGRRLRSPAIIADGRHLQADVISSAGVAGGLAAATVTGLPWLDPLLACLVAINVLWSGVRLIGESVGGLMDEAASPEVQEAVRAAIAQSGDGAIQAHDVITRRAGSMTFIEFHLVVPDDMTVGRSHAICDRIEAAIRERVPGTRISIHVEPPEKAKIKGEVAI
jgi:cation diffusion facilitator family transporter